MIAQTVLAQPKIISNKSLKQPVKSISLHEAIFLALRNNPDIESYALQRVVDKFALEVAHEAFSPQYSFNATAAYQKGSKPEYTIAPGVTIASPIGTSASVSYTNAISGELGTTNLGTTNINITQPLVQGFGSTVNKIPVLNADDTEAIAKINYANNISTIIANVIMQYDELVADYNNLIAQRDSLEQAKKILDQFKLKLKLGKIAPSDVVQQEATYANTELAYTQQKIKQAQDYQQFLQLLGLDPDSRLSIQPKIINSTQIHIPDTKKSIELALKNNPQYKAALLNLKILKRAEIAAKDQQKWQVDLSYNKAIGNIGSSSIVDENSLFGINVNVPIHNMPLKQQLVNAKIAYQEARIAVEKLKRNLISNVIFQIRNLKSLQEQIKLAELGVNYQIKALHATELKQRYGKASSFDLSQQQALLLQQKTNLVNNKIYLINASTNLDLTLGSTLEKWNIRLRY